MGYFSDTIRARLPVEHVDALDRYAALLDVWAARINLTAIRTPDEVADKHFLDSLAVLPHLPPASPPEATRLVDVGTGAGFPGLVLAIARPDLSVTLVEPLKKRVAFLRAVVRELHLPNVTAFDERAEDHLARPTFAPYDVAISRATLHLPDWLALGRRLVRPGGLVIGMEGADQHPLPPDATRVPYTLASNTRALILLRST